MKVTKSVQTHTSDKKSGTRYIWITRYGIETGSDLESNDTAGSVKNFPRTFIPMSELEETLAGE